MISFEKENKKNLKKKHKKKEKRKKRKSVHSLSNVSNFANDVVLLTKFDLFFVQFLQSLRPQDADLCLNQRQANLRKLVLANREARFTKTSQVQKIYKEFKGEVYPEMKLCELLVLVHCIHLPHILFACASSGQSYNIDPPWCLIVVTSLTQRWLETLLRFEVFWTFLEMYSFDRSRLPVCLSSPYYACLVKIWRAILPWKLI